MAKELVHKALAETHNFYITFALGVKIAASLSTTNRRSCQGVLENLLKTQKLDNTQID